MEQISYSISFYCGDQFEAVKKNPNGDIVGYYSWGNKRIGDTTSPTLVTLSLMDTVELPPQYIDERSVTDDVTAATFSGQNLPSVNAAKEIVRYWNCTNNPTENAMPKSNDTFLGSRNMTNFGDVSQLISREAISVMDTDDDDKEYAVALAVAMAIALIDNALTDLPDIQQNTFDVGVLDTVKERIISEGLIPFDNHGSSPEERQLNARNYLYSYLEPQDN